MRLGTKLAIAAGAAAIAYGSTVAKKLEQKHGVQLRRFGRKKPTNTPTQEFLHLYNIKSDQHRELASIKRMILLAKAGYGHYGFDETVDPVREYHEEELSNNLEAVEASYLAAFADSDNINDQCRLIESLASLPISDQNKSKIYSVCTASQEDAIHLQCVRFDEYLAGDDIWSAKVNGSDLLQLTEKYTATPEGKDYLEKQSDAFWVALACTMRECRSHAAIDQIKANIAVLLQEKSAALNLNFHATYRPATVGAEAK